MFIKQSEKIISCTLSLAIMFFLLTTTGCSSRIEQTTLSGWVYASEPVSCAALSVYDTSGKQILKVQSLTANEQGAIFIGIKTKLPSNFRIVAEGGTQYDSEFGAKLSADVREYNAESNTIYINPVTTIVSTYLDKYSEATLAEASATVKKFLEIPESIDLPSGTQLSSEYFNNAQFMTEASENGGINPFIEKLLTEIEAGGTHPFKESLLLQGGAASGIATALAKGAASYVGGELMGWGLDKAGISFGEEDHTAEDLAEIKEGMAEMKTEITEMSIKLDVISSKLDNIVSQLKDMLNQITHQQALSDYGNRVLQLNDLISSIYSIRRDLNNFIMNPPANPETMRKSLINRIESKIIDNADVIHNQLVGLAGEKPLITLWREIVYENRYLDSDDYNKVKSQYEFFRNYQDAILLLQVEYYHATEGETGQNAAIIMDCIDRYKTHLEQQEALLVNPIEENTVVDTKWDGMYYSENIELGKPGGSYTLEDKTKDQVTTYMSELADINYSGFDDWKTLDYDSIGALIENHIYNRAPWSWSEHMVNQGWPGVKVTGVTVIPFYKPTKNDNFVFMLNDNSHFHDIFDFTNAGLKNADFSMIMVYRKVKAKDYGYEHLQK